MPEMIQLSTRLSAPNRPRSPAHDRPIACSESSMSVPKHRKQDWNIFRFRYLHVGSYYGWRKPYASDKIIFQSNVTQQRLIKTTRNEYDLEIYLQAVAFSHVLVA